MLDSQPNWNKILIAFNVLTIISIVLIILTILPPLFCKSIHRRLPWYSHILSWLVLSVALLLMIGHQHEEHPPAKLCFLQSALLYATPPLITFSMACYLLDVNLAFNELLNKRSQRKRKIETSVILGFFPWIIFWAVIIEVSVFFSTASDQFKPSGDPELHLFCHYNSKPTNTISGILVIIATIALFLTKVWSVILIIRKFKSHEWSSTRLSHMVLSAAIRGCVFTGITLVGVIIAQLSCTLKTHDAGWSLVFPILPIIAAVVYGVHADIFRCFLFGNKTKDVKDQERGMTPPLPGENMHVTAIVQVDGQMKF